MKITEDTVKAYLNCKYKSFLKLNSRKGVLHSLEEFYKLNEQNYLKNFQNYLLENKKQITLYKADFLPNKFEKKYDYYFDVTFTWNDCISASGILRTHESDEKIIYSPVLLTQESKISNKQKILLAYQAYVVQFSLTDVTDYGEAIFGDNYSTQKISFKNLFPIVEGIIKEINNIFENSEQFFYLNKHCKICEYKNICNEKAKQSDHLSLISAASEKDVKELNAKGIFTVNQLSYTFKPRRSPKRVKNKIQRHLLALKALAIRKGLIYVYDKNFIFENAPTKIYLDVEGIIDKSEFYYLIGAIIEKEGMPIIEKSYWISFIEESIDGYKKFLDDLNKYCTNDFILFHYGKYEITFLRHLLDITKMQNSNLIVEKLISRSENILSAFLYKIYCPTYSNDLKSISKHLGFTWLSDNVSGLDAIVWRKLWEESNDSQWKDKLINYNLEDCYALKHLVSFIYSLKNENNDSPFSNLNVSQDFTDEIEKRYGGKNFGNKNYVLPDYDYINKKAYFDYQRDKIFIRTNKVFKKVKKSEYKKHFSNKINQEIVLNNQEACIFCSNNKTKVTSQKTERTIIDLKITRNGVKKWIIKYCAYKIYCPKCGKHFSPEKYKEIGKMYGHNLVSWIVYNYIANNTSFEKIEKTLKDCFQISFGETGRSPSQRLKEIAGSYYKETYLKLQTEVRNWHVIHADETRFRLRTSNGYIWVLTNLDTAFFIYRADRTCDFLQEIIENFNGVFISDFYKGYDSLNCAQQKCLIHLLRDINDILFKEQQNNELKIIAQLFNDILRKIVTTIDRYGLKKRNLKKHKKDVMVFYNKVNMIEYKTKYAKALAIRLNRSRPSLFTFLDYDNVPWNNNNAEHSFKHFAVYRKQTNGLFTERSIEDYLILLSLYQTCKYRGINFLKFLLSKEKNICEYQKNYNYAGIKKKNIFEFKKGKNEQHKII